MSADRARIDESAWAERVEALCSPPTIIGAAELLAQADTEPDFIVSGRVLANAVTMVLGAPGCKKSWIAYDLALAVAQGRPWLGSPTLLQGPALILNYDNPTPELARRFKRLGMRANDPVFAHSAPDHALRMPDSIEDLTAICAGVRPAIIINDSMRQSHTADENSSKDMGEVMRCLKRLARSAAVIVVHHSTKGEGPPKARGSGEVDGSCDAEIAVVGDVATWIKHRSWELQPADESIRFGVRDVEGDGTIVERLEAAKKTANNSRRAHRIGE